MEKLANMQPLTNVKQVFSFLGLINQLGKFSPDYSMITTKIRTLLKTGIKFIWTPDHQEEFDKVIQSLSDLENLSLMTLRMNYMPLSMPASVGSASSYSKETVRVGRAFYRLAPPH